MNALVRQNPFPEWEDQQRHRARGFGRARARTEKLQAWGLMKTISIKLLVSVALVLLAAEADTRSGKMFAASSPHV